MDYEFIQSEEMEKTAREWMEFVQNENRKLMEFPEVDRDSIKKLPAVGISTFDQLLEASSTKADREALAARSGASPDSILELVKLSNLSQLPGFKKVRGRLFYKAGLDSLSKIAALESEEIKQRLSEYVQETGFDGSASTVSEAQMAVTVARFLPKIIDFNDG